MIRRSQILMDLGTSAPERASGLHAKAGRRECAGEAGVRQQG